MTQRRAMPQQELPRWHLACRRLLLCTGIAVALSATYAGGAHAASASASAAASGADASADASATDADFDRNLLSGAGNNTTDLSRFEHGNPVLPGIYSTDVFLNDTWVGRGTVRFAAPAPNASATACVDQKLLDQLGLRPEKPTAELLTQMQDPHACLNLGALIPGATMSFDMANLRLDASVPQAYMQHVARGYVSPEYWDKGVTAGLLNYNFNSYHTTSSGYSQTTSYLGLNAGVNIGSWYFRQDSTLTWISAEAGSPARHQWQDIDTYIQRDLPSLRAQLTIGDSYTDGQVFNSFGLRGVQLATDDRMLPDSLRGYAPVVRGIADTNALVTVRQNGVQIYQATVAPGPFTISDLYPTGYGGNLDVSVTEADGRVRSFTVPYASVAQLLRPGVTRFDIAVGQLRNSSLEHQPAVVQGTIQHGFNNLLTGYAGIVGSQGYAAVLLGAAINTRLGAFAADITQASAHIPGYATQSGQSVRLSYSKIIPETNTTLSVAAYRYSTSGFLSLTDAEQARDDVRRGLTAFQYIPPSQIPTIDGVTERSLLSPAQQAALNGTQLNTNLVTTTGILRQRNNFSLTMSQKIGQHSGSFFITTSASDYWNSKGKNTQYQIGYNNTFRRLGYSISATREVDPQGRYDNVYFLSLNLPLGQGSHAPTFTMNLNRSDASGTQEQGMLNGSLGADNQLSYGVTATHGDNGSGNSGTANLGYRSPYAVFNASYGAGSGYSQASLSASGSVVAHPGGVTFGQPIGDTVGIVYVPGAQGARLGNASGARIDAGGYGLIPYLTPYSLNTIQIDPKGLPLDVQLDSTSTQVAPYAGAVVMMKFKTETGRTIIVRASFQDGGAVPFGAEVFNAKGISLGVVGQAGMILLRGVDQSGSLSVRWHDDKGESQSCSFPYQLAPKAKGKGKDLKTYEEIQATCTASNDVALATRKGT